MHNKPYRNLITFRPRRGVVLLLTLVILVVLSTLAYTLTTRLAAQQHRNQYMIDYQRARYACDSGLKYALSTIQDVQATLIARPNKPDFSDLFALDEQQYQQMLEDWGLDSYTDSNTTDPAVAAGIDDVDLDSIFDANSYYDFSGMLGEIPVADANVVPVPGPYGPPWPIVTEPNELEIGHATVRIEIEDENAKMPISWALTEDEETRREADAAFQTFCEWMRMDYEQIEELQMQLEQIAAVKPFKPEVLFEEEGKDAKDSGKDSNDKNKPKRGKRPKSKGYQRPASAHAADFARLFHSPLINRQMLAKPVIDTADRSESALKYLGMWGSRKVNINTAPRHVLEAAFTFGGDAAEIADRIIELRRVEPFESIDKLKESMLEYSESIRRAEDYITTKSTFFTLRVTATSGVAKSSAVVGLIKNGKVVKRLVVFSD